MPAYSPELGHIERFWEHTRRCAKGKIWSNPNEMKNHVADILKNVSEKTVTSLVGYSYILNAISA